MDKQKYKAIIKCYSSDETTGENDSYIYDEKYTYAKNIDEARRNITYQCRRNGIRLGYIEGDGVYYSTWYDIDKIDLEENFEDEKPIIDINSSVKRIISSFGCDKYTQHHIEYFDLTDEIGGHGDYKILLVKIEQEWDEIGIKYYLFLDHKAWVKIWELDKYMKVVKEL